MKNEKRSDEKPGVLGLNRRQFAALAVGAVGSLVVGLAVHRRSALREQQDDTRPSESGRLELPENPNQNPAFQAMRLEDGGVLLATNIKDPTFKAFRLNLNGLHVWQLCDGKRSAAEISSEYVATTGRTSVEAQDFLGQLQKKAIVVSGMHIVHGGGFPKTTAGGWYYRPSI